VHRADNLTPTCAECLETWEPQLPGTLRPVQACNGIALPLLLTVTEDDSLVHHYDLEMKTQSLEYYHLTSPRKKKKIKTRHSA
jgi:hypothetical protein